MPGMGSTQRCSLRPCARSASTGPKKDNLSRRSRSAIRVVIHRGVILKLLFSSALCSLDGISNSPKVTSAPLHRGAFFLLDGSSAVTHHQFALLMGARLALR